MDTVSNTECVNLEVDAAGNVLKTWNLADIVSAAMIAGGDDPTQSSRHRRPTGSITTPPPIVSPIIP